MPRSPLDIAAVHHALGHHLVVTESAALAEHGVHQGGLAVVNMGDDGHIAQVVTNHKIKPLYTMQIGHCLRDR